MVVRDDSHGTCDALRSMNGPRDAISIEHQVGVRLDLSCLDLHPFCGIILERKHEIPHVADNPKFVSPRISSESL